MVPDKALRLEFAVLTKTKQPVVQRHVVNAEAGRVQRAGHIVERVWQAIQAGHFYPAPSPVICPSCPFREPCQNWRG